LLLVAVFCFAFSPVCPAASVPAAPASRVATPFGIPLPTSHDRAAWQQWRQQVQARIESRRARLRANAASGGSSGIIETLAGAAAFQKPVNALKTGFGQIQGIAEDGGGNLYVASCDLGVVLKVDPSSNTSVYAGQPLATGPAASAGDGGPATSARLVCPSALALDGTGNLYISDTDAGTVRVVDAATGVIQTIAGTPGQRGYGGDGGPATAATLDFPTGLALDGNGNLFIEDGEFIREVNLTTGLIQTIAGGIPSPVPCPLSATTTCPATQVDYDAFGPTIVFAQGHLYAGLNSVYTGSVYLDGCIVSIDPSTGIMQLIAGGGPNAGTSSTYPGIGLEMQPQGLATDARGNLFIANPVQGLGTLNQPPIVPSIEEFSASDNTVHVIAGNGDPKDYSGSGDGGAAMMAGLGYPAAICLSPTGSVVFADNFRIRSFPIGGNIATVAGVVPANYFGDNGAATQAGLDKPSSVVADAQGNVYVADTLNSRIRRIDAVTGMITTVAGGGTSYGAAADGGSALKTALLYPTDLVFDTSDHLYVRGMFGLQAIDLKTGLITTLLPNVLTTGGMVFDGDKTLYIAASHLASGAPYLTNNDQVWAIDVTTGTPTVIAGNGAISYQPTGDGGPATKASLYDVSGLALDGKGNLYLADDNFDNVRRIDLTTGVIQTIAGTHSDSSRAVGYSGDGGPAVDALLSYPAGLTYDGAGHLIVLDSGNDVLRQIDLTANIITTIAGDHVRGFGGDGGAATAAMLYFPQATTVDPSGNIFVADTNNDRVRRILLHPTALTATLSDTQGSDGSITFAATYSGLSFGFAPTGTVTFSSSGTALGSGTLAPAADDSGTFVATVTAASLPANGATMTAHYSGDVHYAAVSKTITFQQPSYTVSAAPASLSIQQGSSGSITFTVTPQNGFHEQVSFACDPSSLPHGVTCSFSPASVTPTGSSAVTTTLTVTTTGASLASIDPPAGAHSGWLPRGGAMLALVVFLVPPIRRRMWLGGAAILLFAVCLGGISGCGGAGAKGGGGGSQNPNATPLGSYVIHVNSSVGSQQGAAPVSVSITVKG
jgi:sugar lactone lactonase YvrE